MDLRVGDIVFGATEHQKYEVAQLIDSGGFGTVYEIRDHNGNAFALKTILTALLDDTKLSALQNESRLATEIVHPKCDTSIPFSRWKAVSKPASLHDYGICRWWNSQRPNS